MSKVFVPQSRQELLLRWLQRLRLLEQCHYEAARPLASMNLALGIPVVVLTTVVGTTIFASLQKSVDTTTKLWVAIISLTAAVLSALQTFFRFHARATTHREIAAKAGIYRREIEQILADEETAELTKEALDALREKIDLLASSDATVPSKVYDRLKNQN